MASRLVALSRAEWLLLAESTIVALVVEVALRCVSLWRVVEWCQRPRAARPWPLTSADRVAVLARWHQRVVPVPATCLRDSLVLTALLRRRGLPASVRFGVRRRAGELLAHAWVECPGLSTSSWGAEGFEALGSPEIRSLNRTVRWQP